MYRNYHHCIWGVVTFFVALAGLVLAIVTFLKLRECESCYDDFAFNEDDGDVPYFTADMTDDDGDDYPDVPVDAAGDGENI